MVWPDRAREAQRQARRFAARRPRSAGLVSRLEVPDARSLALACGFTKCYNNIVVDSTEVIRLLKRAGWVHVHTKGSHTHFKHPTRPGKVTVPHPRKDLPLGTLKSIERQSAVTLT